MVVGRQRGVVPQTVPAEKNGGRLEATTLAPGLSGRVLVRRQRRWPAHCNLKLRADRLHFRVSLKDLVAHLPTPA